jgi:hypothetical protein
MQYFEADTRSNKSLCIFSVCMASNKQTQKAQSTKIYVTCCLFKIFYNKIILTLEITPELLDLSIKPNRG